MYKKSLLTSNFLCGAQDDGGIRIDAYKFQASIDEGATWVDHGIVPVEAFVPDATGLMTHTVTALENDKPTLLGILAVNFYGEGNKYYGLNHLIKIFIQR
jgi:hypothetical protein